MNINLEPLELSAFVMSASLGSMVSASETLGIGQPSLSKRIAQLERKIGSTLLYRTRDGVKPTSAGKILIEYAKNQTCLQKNLINELRLMDSGIKGEISLGAHSIIAKSFFPSAALKIHSNYPELKLNFYIGRSTEVTKKISENQLDFGLVANPVKNADLVTLPFFKAHVFLYTSRISKKHNRVYFNPEMVDHQKIQNTLRKIGDLEVIPIRDYELILKFIQAGLGIGALPTHFAEESETQIKIFSEKPLTESTLKWVYSKNPKKSKVFNEVIYSTT